jgi:hypothetical protein
LSDKSFTCVLLPLPSIPSKAIKKFFFISI